MLRRRFNGAKRITEARDTFGSGRGAFCTGRSKVIYELVENYELGLIDLALTQNAKNYTQYLGDSLHPSDKGMEAYSATAIKAINEYFGKN